MPTFPVRLGLLEIGYLLGMLIERTTSEDPVARSLFVKLKAASIEAAVEWDYELEPWESEKP